MLCYLVKNNQMDIYNINISEIIEQYLIYLEEMRELNLEIASEFIVMASTLLYIKSKKLIPTKKEEVDEITEEELVNRIIEYSKYKEISKKFKDKYLEYNYRVTKPQTLLTLPKKEFAGTYSIEELSKAYKRQILKYKEKENQKKDDIEKLVLKENITIKSKLKEVLKVFAKTKEFVFNKIFMGEKRSKQEIVVAFLAVLEMSKKDKVTIEQKGLFSDINVKKID